MTGRSAAIRAATATASMIATTAGIVVSAIIKAKAGKRGPANEGRPSEGRPPAPERQQEPVAEGGNDPRRRDRFQQPHEQPEFLRRPVRRARVESDEAEKDETSRD